MSSITDTSILMPVMDFLPQFPLLLYFLMIILFSLYRMYFYVS